ncbi:MAG: InlB B-repeat-containing protein, partial [Leptospirales bacterium]|nr:InlB B-repeat-containing protein [Leptospirales bacterium]
GTQHISADAEIVFGATFPSNSVMYAQWISFFTITYSGIVPDNDNPAEYIPERMAAPIDLLQPGEREGYIWEGWWTAPVGGTKYESIASIRKRS